MDRVALDNRGHLAAVGSQFLDLFLFRLDPVSLGLGQFFALDDLEVVRHIKAKAHYGRAK